MSQLEKLLGASLPRLSRRRGPATEADERRRQRAGLTLRYPGRTPGLRPWGKRDWEEGTCCLVGLIYREARRIQGASRVGAFVRGVLPARPESEKIGTRQDRTPSIASWARGRPRPPTEVSSCNRTRAGSLGRRFQFTPCLYFGPRLGAARARNTNVCGGGHLVPEHGCRYSWCSCCTISGWSARVRGTSPEFHGRRASSSVHGLDWHWTIQPPRF